MKITERTPTRLVVTDTPWFRAGLAAGPAVLGAIVFAGFGWGEMLIGGLLMVAGVGYFLASAQWMDLTFDRARGRITLTRDPLWGEAVTVHLGFEDCRGVALQITEVWKLRLYRPGLDLPAGFLSLVALPGIEPRLGEVQEIATLWLDQSSEAGPPEENRAIG
ncbi:hypothetical protein [uncultured Maritimibacter sp.]|jgi:hypothetical protein|uniref:hypothetical protein n=1 Tax=uncultured Maritimibacter sp. TaxID=991866 RepID=UPI002636C422|nr:hypothetical protein [uncultured Maritimibacter sp.]